jgi:glyoxylase-like metal-dependent hydrolase (beta-lactamase superfamily II)
MEVMRGTAGYCEQLERVVRKGGEWRTIRFPAAFALIRHPEHGYILFDTGYSEHNFAEMKAFPYRIYQWITPITLPEGHSVKAQLQARGISPEAIRYIILSHLHADHIGGCRDFPNATFICSKREYAEIGSKRGFAALKEAFVPGLLPSDFEQRATFVEDKPRKRWPVVGDVFEDVYDVFGDGSIGAVFLPGHTAHQFGIVLQAEGRDLFFVSDACWTHEAYRTMEVPMRIVSLIKSSYADYIDTLERIHKLHVLHPQLEIIPCHAEVMADA